MVNKAAVCELQQVGTDATTAAAGESKGDGYSGNGKDSDGSSDGSSGAAGGAAHGASGEGAYIGVPDAETAQLLQVAGLLPGDDVGLSQMYPVPAHVLCGYPGSLLGALMNVGYSPGPDGRVYVHRGDGRQPASNTVPSRREVRNGLAILFVPAILTAEIGTDCEKVNHLAVQAALGPRGVAVALFQSADRSSMTIRWLHGVMPPVVPSHAGAGVAAAATAAGVVDGAGDEDEKDQEDQEGQEGEGPPAMYSPGTEMSLERLQDLVRT